MFIGAKFCKNGGKIWKNPRRIQRKKSISKRFLLYLSFFFYSARVSCVSDDIFWFSIGIFCDKRTRRPAANVANPQSNSGIFLTISIKNSGDRKCDPLPLWVSILRICHLSCGNICASFTFPGRFMWNSFKMYEVRMCRLATSSKSPSLLSRDFIDF